MSPYPGEHACRIVDPDNFEKGSFRRMKRGKLSIIIGRLKGETTTTTQAYRYPKEDWGEAEARAHCKENEGSFEPASDRAQEMSPEEAVDPGENPFIPTDEE